MLIHSADVSRRPRKKPTFSRGVHFNVVNLYYICSSYSWPRPRIKSDLLKICKIIFFRVSMDNFANVLMTDAHMVKLMEGCNFCVPSTNQLYKAGSSTFWNFSL